MKVSSDLTHEQKTRLREGRYKWLLRRIGERQKRTQFLLFPKRLYDPKEDRMVTRWLEKATYIMVLTHYYYWNEPPVEPDRHIFRDRNETFEWVETEWGD